MRALEERDHKLQKILVKTLAEHQGRNPQYSLRAFARRLKVSPASLSEILRGQRKVSERKFHFLLEQLDLSPSEMKTVLGDALEIAKRNEIPADHYHLLADWYYFAILSLAETSGFKGSVEDIVERLGLSQTLAQAAVERLQRLGLMIERKGKWISTGSHISSPDDVKSLALRKSHHQNLELAKRALEEQEVHERDFTSLTLAMDGKRLPEIKQRIRKFLMQLNQEFETQNKTDVYKVNFQAFSLTRRRS
jgi:transcriptional regulator with XRE-family HTH domain